MTKPLARIAISLLVVTAACTSDDGSGSQGPIGGTFERPTYDWGYPQYSEYDANGNHVGTNFYQQDPACIERLMFYKCAAVDAETPLSNPTGASTALTGGDQCTVAIEAERPSYCMPADVCDPRLQATAWAPGQGSVDNLGWQLFIAANWPADSNEPGYPDTSKDLGAPAPSGPGHARAVWLDYPTPEDLFGVPSPCGEEGITLTTRGKVSRQFLSKPHPLEALGGVVQPGGGVLVDQNNRVVYTDIRVNRTEWEFIVNQNDYWQTGTEIDVPKGLQRDYGALPGQTQGAFPAAPYLPDDPNAMVDVGSMEIKAAWKQLTQEEISSGTFYMHTMTLYDPDGVEGEQCTEQLMGLVGMHIVYMPAQFGNPEWVWATFEHRLNVPTTGINDGATAFSFHNPECVNSKTAVECAAYDPSTDSPSEFACCPNLKLYSSAADLPDEGQPVANQVTRMIDPTVSTILPTNCTEYHTNAITEHFGADNVWKNYFLVSAQWPLRGSSTNFPFYEPSAETNFPCLLRNTTLETFNASVTSPASTGCTVDPNTPVPFCRSCNGDCTDEATADLPCMDGAPVPDQFNTASCMGCHSMYAGNNSSFIFSHRPCCVREDGAQPNDCGNFLNESACTADSSCTWVSSDPSCS